MITLINVKLSMFNTIILIILSYLITDLSHIIFNEPTYRSKYNGIKKKLNHHLFLPLLILDSIFFKPCYFKSGEVEIDNELLEYTNNIKVNKRFTNLELNFSYNLDVDSSIRKFLEDNNLNHK